MQVELSIQDAIQKDDFDSASLLVDRALKNFPKSGGVLNLKGVVEARQNRITDARADFTRAVTLAPALTPAWQNLARTCQSLTGPDAAVSDAAACATQAWHHVLRLKPGDAEAVSSLALLDAQSDRFAESIRQLNQLAVEASQQPQTLLLRCLDLAHLQRVPEAAALATKLAARDDFTEADLDRVGQILDKPGSSPVVVTVVVTLIQGLDGRHAVGLSNLQRLALAYEREQRPQEARKTLDRVALLDPRNTAHLLELARLAELSKDHEDALGYLAHARDLTPDDPRIHFLFGAIAAKMDLPIEARASLERAIALKPDDPTYNYTMGTVLLNTHDALSAAKYLQQFILLKPSDPQGHYALGIAYFAAGDYDNAKREMLGIEGEPQQQAGANYFLGRMARSDGDLTDATRRLRKSIELLPNFSESHTQLARVLMDQENLDEARVEIEKALQLDPNSFQGNNQLLVLYRRLHDPRGDRQAELLKKLDEDRSKRAELMLRTIEVRP